MTPCTRTLLAGLVVALSAGRAPAFEHKETQGPATLEMRTDGGQPRLALSDVLEVTVTVDGSRDLRVAAVRPLGMSWEVVSTVTTTQPRADGLRWRQTLRLAPTEPGELKLELPPLSVRDRDGERMVVFKPVTIPVTTQIQQIELGSVRDITAIEELPSPTAESMSWAWLALSGGAVVMLAGAWLWSFRRARPRPASALRQAEKECDRLVALQLAQRQHVKSFVTLLSGIVRRYLERRYGLPARRRTTAELLRELANHADVSADTRRWLQEFFAQTDPVKFAGAALAVERCTALVDEVRAFCRASSATPPVR